MLYKDYIRSLQDEFVGKMVNYNGNVYRITQVDYNGIIHIDLKAQYTDDTAVYDVAEARKNLVTDSAAFETMLDRMIELLNVQQQNCVNAGATVSENTLAYPKNGNKRQNSYYMGYLNMAQSLAWEIGKDIIKRNGKHYLIKEA